MEQPDLFGVTTQSLAADYASARVAPVVHPPQRPPLEPEMAELQQRRAERAATLELGQALEERAARIAEARARRDQRRAEMGPA